MSTVSVHLPAAPLLRQVALRGGRKACGVRQHSWEEKALDRAQACGWVTPTSADELAIRLLGLTPLELWADEWLDGLSVSEPGAGQ